MNHGGKGTRISRGRNNKRAEEGKGNGWERVGGCFSRSLKTASPDEASSSKERSACTVRMLPSSKVLLFVVVRFLYQLPTTRPGAFISFAVIFWVAAPLFVTLRLLRQQRSAAPRSVFSLKEINHGVPFRGRQTKVQLRVIISSSR